MQRLGQTKSIYLKTKHQIIGDFVQTKRKTLNTQARPCEEDNEFSFTDCVLEFLARKVGCHLDWVGNYRKDRYLTIGFNI